MSEQDLELLFSLHDYMYLDKAFIREHIYTTYKHTVSVDNRLNRLKQREYLTAFSVQLDPKVLSVSHVYTLGKQGAQVVEALKGVSHWKPSWSQDLRPIWRHQLMIAQVVKRYEKQAEAAGLEVKEFIPEPRAFYQFDGGDTGKKNNVIRPDGILVIGKPGVDQNVGIMLEMERSYSTRELTVRKVEQYNRFFYGLAEYGPAYDKYVAFNHPVMDWRLLFIGGTDAKAKKLFRDLKEITSAVTVLVSSKDLIEQTPYGKVYQDVQAPEVWRTL